MKKILIWILLTIALMALAIFLWEKSKKNVGNAITDIVKEEKIIAHDVVLEQIKMTGKLELVNMKMKDVLEYTIERKFLPDPKAVLIISGEAVGCIDLMKIGEHDIVEKDSVVYVRLPKPEICYVKVNHDESRVFNTSNAYFNEAEIVQNAYKSAEKQIQRTAQQSNIIEQTRINAELVLRPLLTKVAKMPIKFTDQLPEVKINKDPLDAPQNTKTQTSH